MSLKYHNRVVEVLGEKWKIKRLKNLIEIRGANGLCVFKTKEIIIDASLTGYELEHTLLHELGHALVYRSGISQAIADEVEEILVEIFGTFLLDTYSLRLLNKRKS